MYPLFVSAHRPFLEPADVRLRKYTRSASGAFSRMGLSHPLNHYCGECGSTACPASPASPCTGRVQ